jgi:hypothetical protein
MWGDVAPDTIAFEMMSAWRAGLERKHGRGVAHKTMRVWRTFWRIMRGMKVARTEDPSLGVRNRAPAPRWQQWSEGEAVRLVKEARRRGYHAGLHHRGVLGHLFLSGGRADTCGAASGPQWRADDV